MLYGNAVVGQSGGPTAAINATLAGVIRGAKDKISEGIIGKLYGMRFGIEGFLAENLVDLSEMPEEDLSVLENTPAAALGSCRKKMKSPKDDPETYAKIFEILKKYSIRYFFYIGGNDSMDTVLKLSDYANGNDYELRVVGVPKTIDNDLAVTDHTPGFGSAAKFVATEIKEILRDIQVYSVKAVTIVEIMGRDAGWLTTAAALPKRSGGECPDLIYLPEKPFVMDEFIEDVKKAQETHPALLVAVSEGIRFADGEYVGASGQSGAVDVFGHKYLAGAGKVLESVIKEKIGCKVRSIELSLPQRCASHNASLTDISESVLVGKSAVIATANGETGVMMYFERQPGENYRVEVKSAPIAGIANAVRGVPDDYINDRHNGVTEKCLDYLQPLIEGETKPVFENGLPKHFTF